MMALVTAHMTALLATLALQGMPEIQRNVPTLISGFLLGYVLYRAVLITHTLLIHRAEIRVALRYAMVKPLKDAVKGAVKTKQDIWITECPLCGTNHSHDSSLHAGHDNELVTLITNAY